MNTEIDTSERNRILRLEGATEVLRWRISDTWQRTVMVQLVGLLLLIVMGFVFYHLARVIGRVPDNPSTNRLVLILSLLSVIPLHVDNSDTLQRTLILSTENQIVVFLHSDAWQLRALVSYCYWHSQRRRV